MREDYVTKMASAFESELQKIAATSNRLAAKMVVPAVAGSAFTLAALRANEDRKIGRQVRLQQNGQSY